MTDREAFDYNAEKKAYMDAANWLFLTYDNLETAIEYFRLAEARIAPFDERELILDGIRELQKECEELEQKTSDIYNRLLGR